MEKLKNLASKCKAGVMALGVAVLPFLSQVTVSGAMVELEQSDVASISSSIGQGLSGIFHNTVAMIGVIAMLTFGWMTVRFIAKKARGK